MTRIDRLTDLLERQKIGFDTGNDLTLRASIPGLLAIARAAADPLLVILEAHPGADPDTNQIIADAAQRLRDALADFEKGSR